MSRLEVAHAILDALERVGAPYYAVNHIPAHQIGVLADFLAGWLVPGPDGKATQKPRLPDTGPTRVYVFGSKIWEGGADE